MRTARRGLISSCVLMLCVIPTPAQEKNDGPSNEKAQKTYKEALKCLLERRTDFALGALKKADKQDDGKVPGVPARNGQVRNAARRMEDAELGAEELVAEAQDERSKALAHYQFAVLLMSEGLQRHKEEYFARVHEEASKAIAAYAKFPDAMFIDGRALAQLKQDEAAKSKFDEFVKLKPEGDANRGRALRFISQPELARARIAPCF